jgi:hypothetical protein
MITEVKRREWVSKEKGIQSRRKENSNWGSKKMEVIGEEMGRIKEVRIERKKWKRQKRERGWVAEEDNKEIWETNNGKAEMLNSHSEFSNMLERCN